MSRGLRGSRGKRSVRRVARPKNESRQTTPLVERLFMEILVNRGTALNASGGEWDKTLDTLRQLEILVQLEIDKETIVEKEE